MSDTSTPAKPWQHGSGSVFLNLKETKQERWFGTFYEMHQNPKRADNRGFYDGHAFIINDMERLARSFACPNCRASGEKFEDVVKPDLRKEFEAEKKQWLTWDKWSNHAPGLFKLECKWRRMIARSVTSSRKTPGRANYPQKERPKRNDV